MARMIRMFLIVSCMIMRTLQYENEQVQPKSLHVYSSKDDYMNKPAIFTANSNENNAFIRRKRDSNAPTEKVENHKNISTVVSGKCVKNFFFYFIGMTRRGI